MSPPLLVERRPEGLLLCMDESHVSEQTTHQLAPDPSVDCACRVVLDLRNVRFIEPFGIIYLFWMVGTLLNRGAERVTIMPPDSEDVRNYLVRMHFPQLFSDETRVRFRPVDIANRRVRERNLSERLVEATRFALENDDEVRALTASVMETILSQAGELSVETRRLRLGIVELLSNVEVHSQTGSGLLTVQTYAGGRVQIAIGDGGIGIPAALRDVVGDLPDDQTIRCALERNVSSRVGRGGLGLPSIVEEVEATDGYMVIRSGCAQVKVGSGEVSSRNDCTPILGTQIEILWAP